MVVSLSEETSRPNTSDVVGLRKFIRRCYVDGRETSDSDDQEGSGRKRKKVEVPENAFIIKDLPSLSLPPNEIVMRLRDLCRLTVSQTSKPLTPTIVYSNDLNLEPYPWKDLSIEQLASKGLETVSGEVRCFDCGYTSKASLDWREAWVKSASFMLANFITFGEDTYLSWTLPFGDFLIRCSDCRGKMVPHIDPVEINWLFLFLTNTVSKVSAPILEHYIQSRGILLSETPSKKELVLFLHLYMLRLLDPKGVWAGFSFFANNQVTLAYDKDTSLTKLNLSMGAYLTEEGKQLVFNVVRQAEQQLLVDNQTRLKNDIPITGLADFNKSSAKLLFGADREQDNYSAMLVWN